MEQSASLSVVLADTVAGGANELWVKSVDVIDHGAIEPLAANAIINGDFEVTTLDASKPSAPTGAGGQRSPRILAWEAGQKTYASNIQWQDEAGNHYLRLGTGNINTPAMVHQKVSIKPGWRKMVLTARMKAWNLIKGPEAYHNPRITVRLLDKDGNEINVAKVIEMNANAEKWKPVKEYFSLTNDAAYADVEIANLAENGYFGVDDVVLRARK
jgi:hypothetical protein